ncbi:MAG: hypothetical protein WC760_07295 [Bacteroidia bacterium]|jgi:hypothetical protein
MIFITICITLLTLIAALHLLAKVQKDGLGKMFTWASYLIIAVAVLVLICEVTRGIGRMACSHDGKYNHEMACCPMMGSEGHHEGMKKGCCKPGDKAMMQKDMEDDDDDAEEHEHPADSVH